MCNDGRSEAERRLLDDDLRSVVHPEPKVSEGRWMAASGCRRKLAARLAGVGCGPAAQGRIATDCFGEQNHQRSCLSGLSAAGEYSF